MKPVDQLPPPMQAALKKARDRIDREALVLAVAAQACDGNTNAAHGMVHALVASRRLITYDDGTVATSPAIAQTFPSTTLARCPCGMPVVTEGDSCAACVDAARPKPRQPWARRANNRSHGKRRHQVAPPAPGGARESAVCPNPLKVGYRDKRDALLALTAGGWYDQWPYLCSCGSWHNATERWTPGWRARLLDTLAEDPGAPITRDVYERSA